MKFLMAALLAAALLLGAISSQQARAAGPDPIKQFDLVASRFVADPARHQIYASITGGNSVVVIDTNSLAVTQTLAIGSAPVGMSISPDGTKLYVALSGAKQIGVIDLESLTIAATLTVEIKPYDVAAGLGNHLYITPVEQANKLLQVDATTGATQASLDDSPYFNGRLQMSPDHKTLYFATKGLSPNTVERFDVATSTAVVEEYSVTNGGDELRLSHDGLFLTTRYDLFDAANFKVFEGTFADRNGEPLEAVAFSPDDTVLYEYGLFTNQISFFSTESFLKVAELELATSGVTDVFDLIADNSAHYLLVASDTGILVYDLFTSSTVSASGTVGLRLDYHPPIYLEAPTITTSELPPGLVFDLARQAITGRPTETGSFTVVVTGVGQGHTVTATVNLTIVPNQIGQSETSTNLIARLNLVASRFLGDPARKRIYASLNGENSVAVIDTTGLEVIKTLAVGSAPLGMAMSPDGKKLYVALSGATKIAIMDLDTLTVLPGLLIGEKPYQIEAGLANRLYVTPLGEDYDLVQIDATTGATEGILDDFPYRNGLLQISPDRNTLYFGNNGLSPATLERFDVSTASAVIEESITRNGGGDLTLSHGGQLLSFPLNSIDPANLNTVYGSYVFGTTGSPLSYSPNDGLVYSYDLYQNKVNLFSTVNFGHLAILDVSDRARCGEFCAGTQMASDLITDETGRYLCLAEDSSLSIYDLVADVTISVSGTVGEAFDYQLPIYFDANQIIPDSLPPGLLFDSTTRTITGTPMSDGTYPIKVTASDGTNSITINLTLNLYPNSRAQNISTRLAVQTGDDVLISGFIITGNETKEVVVRAIGPSLEFDGQPVPGRLSNPILELHDGSGALIASNDNWASDESAYVLTNLNIAPTNPLEAALYRRLAPGAYTMIVRGSGNTTGIALAEVYDIDSQGQTTMAGGSRLANISTRGKVETGDNVMIGGFIVGGDDDAMMLIRAIGPSLSDAGVAGALQDPHLDLFDSQGTKILSNDNWKDTQEAAIIASGLAPTDDRESAISITLPPAAYTAIVSGVGEMTGVALVEAYNLP